MYYEDRCKFCEKNFCIIRGPKKQQVPAVWRKGRNEELLNL